MSARRGGMGSSKQEPLTSVVRHHLHSSLPDPLRCAAGGSHVEREPPEAHALCGIRRRAVPLPRKAPRRPPPRHARDGVREPAESPSRGRRGDGEARNAGVRRDCMRFAQKRGLRATGTTVMCCPACLGNTRAGGTAERVGAHCMLTSSNCCASTRNRPRIAEQVKDTQSTVVFSQCRSRRSCVITIVRADLAAL
jgi:hypothetical protein